MAETAEIPEYVAVLRKIDVNSDSQVRSAKEIINFLRTGQMIEVMRDGEISNKLRESARQRYLECAKKSSFGSKDAIEFLSAFPAAIEKERELMFDRLVDDAVFKGNYSRLLDLRDNNATINDVKVEVPLNSRNRAEVNVERALNRHLMGCATVVDGSRADRSHGLAKLLAVMQDERLPQAPRDRAANIINVADSVQLQREAVAKALDYKNFRFLSADRWVGRKDYNQQKVKLQELQTNLATLLHRK